ncbi:UDP-3-O-(3-hydroxymyristoyl)glucosamine N-acyltransferase [Marinomonas primoryensis]|uniref:UDP-3-O-(3-hydroxymyristoyl)glucosamine N-acyltransferase n=1 Tax=Marinomonas primoryensis TaxID=178399 RepID=A0A859CZE1_9GAMM|nr:UDP-3-O-(3-hydroxymyristoyl)glucosamine N-acyltransferase [Marinomonas primoryensis]QKK81968.1 uncharacterized protein MP3633_3241 [Marinomonas primoryensis]
MSNVRIIVDKYVKRELEKLTILKGCILEAPYVFETYSNICDFSIVFNTENENWVLDETNFVSIILAKSEPENLDQCKNKVICICDNPRDIYAYLMNISLTGERLTWSRGDNINYIHPTAKVHPSTEISSNVYISEDVEIGPNCSIGFQGFGFGRLEGKAFRLIHTGGVFIGKGTKISSNVTVVSGTFNPTTIGENVLVDDHVHIAHNCIIENYVTLTAGTVLSGSVALGENTWLGPNSSVINGAKLGKDVFAGIGACVTKSFEGGVIAGNPAKKLRAN